MSADPRSLHGDLERLQARFGSVAGELDRSLRVAIEAQPLLAVGAAAGVGFLLGGGLTRGAATLLLGAGARMVGAWLDEQIHARTDAHGEEDGR